jgi:ribosomal protein S16
MTMSQTLITSRDPKGLHAVGLFEAVYNKSKLDEARAQRLNERGGELQDGIAKLIAELSVSNQYANEEVRSSYTYPKEYKGPKPIADQIKALAKIFDLDPSHAIEFAKNLPALPEGAEGWFAIPSVDALAKKHFPEVTDPVQKYCQAVQLVHAKIAASRSFYNYREGQITPAQLRVHARTAHALDLIAETQKGDILIVAAQLGMRHRGKSVRRAREVFVANEFGLGSLAVGSIVLTHPERLVRWEELDMDCSGDEFSPVADGDFSESPCFDFGDGEVGFDTYFVGGPGDGFGSVSGFLSQ